MKLQLIAFAFSALSVLSSCLERAEAPSTNKLTDIVDSYVGEEFSGNSVLLVRYIGNSSYSLTAVDNFKLIDWCSHILLFNRKGVKGVFCFSVSLMSTGVSHGLLKHEFATLGLDTSADSGYEPAIWKITATDNIFVDKEYGYKMNEKRVIRDVFVPPN